MSQPKPTTLPPRHALKQMAVDVKTAQELTGTAMALFRKHEQRSKP